MSIDQQSVTRDAGQRIWLTAMLALLFQVPGNLVTSFRYRSFELAAYVLLALVVGGVADRALRAKGAVLWLSQMAVGGVAVNRTVNARDTLGIDGEQARRMLTGG